MIKEDSERTKKEFGFIHGVGVLPAHVALSQHSTEDPQGRKKFYPFLQSSMAARPPRYIKTYLPDCVIQAEAST